VNPSRRSMPPFLGRGWLFPSSLPNPTVFSASTSAGLWYRFEARLPRMTDLGLEDVADERHPVGVAMRVLADLGRV